MNSFVSLQILLPIYPVSTLIFPPSQKCIFLNSVLLHALSIIALEYYLETLDGLPLNVCIIKNVFHQYSSFQRLVHCPNDPTGFLVHQTSEGTPTWKMVVGGACTQHHLLYWCQCCLEFLNLPLHSTLNSGRGTMRSITDAASCIPTALVPSKAKEVLFHSPFCILPELQQCMRIRLPTSR